MKYFGDDLSEMHKELNAAIRKPERLVDAKRMFLDLHSKLHPSVMTDTDENEVDALLSDLLPHEYSIMPTAKDETIAWALWHLARIEDLTMGILVAEGEPVFNRQWQEQMHAIITDTGNALTDDEIIEFSKGIDTNHLVAYRNAVGKKTRDIVGALTADDMKRRVSTQGLDRIRETGGVTSQEESVWLLDFWGKKDVAGLLLMPPTRHVIMHLNDCCKWKLHIRAGKRCYRSE